MKKILVPTDFSANAEHACIFAIEIARITGASITLVNSLYIPYSDSSMIVNIKKQMLMIAEKDMDQLVTRLKDRMGEVPLLHEITSGSPVDVIPKLAHADKYDLIIMGTEGASGLERVFMGSNTASIISSSKIPVLAIPHNARFTSINKILFSTDLLEGENPVMTELVEFAKLFDSELHILHVIEPGAVDTIGQLESYKEELHQRIKYPKLQIEIHRADSAYEAINEYIMENDISIVAMLTRRRNFFQRIFEASLTKRMAYHSRIPLLAFHQ